MYGNRIANAATFGAGRLNIKLFVVGIVKLTLNDKMYFLLELLSFLSRQNFLSMIICQLLSQRKYLTRHKLI